MDGPGITLNALMNMVMPVEIKRIIRISPVILQVPTTDAICMITDFNRCSISRVLFFYFS